ncbi:hypothetical protein DL771_007382 [Monosporascus sp. 5C6A]|nr:hypothetical protein DL771_007382 [Monosporascus sp. 5C6A]
MRAVGEKAALLGSDDDSDGSLLPWDWARVPTPPQHDIAEIDDDAPGEGERRGRRQERPRRLPQAIAHRGYSAVAPENTIEAFRRAAEAGAHALETDLRLSRDGVVVLMHDASLKRTFGEDSKVRDHDWSYLSQLRTLRKPHQPMARLVDLLEYLNEPGLERIWVMFDIKRDGDPGEMLQRIAATLDSVPARARGGRPWRDRVLVCCWNAAFAREGARHLPGFRLAHVGFSTTYARALLRHGLVSAASMLRFSLASPLLGARFARDMRRAGVPLFVWTVNDAAWMRWAVRGRLDGVITDDPKLFLEVCRGMAVTGGEGGDDPDGNGGGDGVEREARGPLRKLARSAKFCAQVLLVEFLHFIWLIYLFWQHGGVEKEVGRSLVA